MKNKIKALNKNIVKLSEELEAYIKDTSIPLKDRWELFVDAPNCLSIVSDWIQDFKIENFDPRKQYEDLSRRENVFAVDFVDRVTESFSYKKTLSDEQIEEISNKLKEHFLSKNLKCFQYDW